MERIGIIGLGRMGGAMAARMADQGAKVTAWTRSGLTPARAREIGVEAALDLAQLAQGSDILILSLFDDAAVRDVMAELMQTDLTGKLIIDTSTVSPKLLSGFTGTCAAALVDAPISGGPEMVTDATCGVFLGGAETDVARARAAVALFSGRIFHAGPLGAGMGMKIVVNAMIGGIMASLTEVIQIAKRSGLDYAATLQIVAGGPAGAPFINARLARMLGEDESIGFPVSAVLKDVGVFRAAAHELGVDAPMLANVHAMAETGASEGLGELDIATVVRAAWDRA